MKLTINRDRLADIVTRGVSSAPKNSPSVIANNARITVEDGKLSIASTDFDMMTEASGDCMMERGGTTTVDAAKLKLVVDRLPKGVDVSITFDDAKYELIVKAGRSRSTFPTLASEDWPARVQKLEGAEFTLSGSDLVRLFGHTAQALSTIPGSAMSGVFLHIREVTGKAPTLAAVGTTGSILILATIAAPDGSENMPGREGFPAGVILSAETVNSVLRLFKAAEEVKVIVNSNTIYFRTNDIHYCSAMLTGTYPNYGPLVANPSEARALVDRALCINTVALLEPFASKDLGHRLQCAASDEGFVFAVGGQTGGGVDVVEAEIEGDVEPFGINGMFLKVMLNSFKTETIAMHPDATNSRVVFQSESEPDLIGAIAMMKITTDLAAGPKHE